MWSISIERRGIVVAGGTAGARYGGAVDGADKDIAMQMTAVLNPAEEGGFIALNPETGCATQGETIEEAIAALREAVELYLEEFPLKSSGAPIVTTFDVVAHA